MIIQAINKILTQITLLRRLLIVAKCKKYLGIDFTPLDVIPDELGCAEAVTTILKEAGMIDRMIAGTWSLYDYLNRNKYWSPTLTPQPGDIIISPTGESRYGKKAPFVGHVGIVGENRMIYANSSSTGKWSTHYTIESWKARYGDKGGYPCLYYRYISVL